MTAAPMVNLLDLLEDLRKFHGLPPYDEGSNIVRGDGYFYSSLVRKYGAAHVREAERRVKLMQQRAAQLRRQFLSEFPNSK